MNLLLSFRKRQQIHFNPRNNSEHKRYAHAIINALVSFTALLFPITATAKLISSNIQFDYITIAEGLSQNYVTDIAEDAEGFIWIGTKNGLNKYNGYEIVQYNHLPDNELSVPSNYIEVIYRDSRGNLWIGTQNGLCKYISEDDSFKQLKLSGSSLQYGYNHILSIYEDFDGVLWAGSTGGILYSYHPDNEEVKAHDSLAGEITIRKIAGYNNELLIGSTHKGTIRFNPAKDFFYETAADSITNNQSVTTFTTDNKGNLWVGIHNKGLLRYGENQFKLFGETVLDIHIYNHTTALIGTEEHGLICYNLSTGEYQAIENNQKKFGINSEGITSIYSDLCGRIWLGTINGGVNIFDPNKNHFKHLPLSANKETSSMQCVFAIEEYDDESILVGLNTKGVYSLNKWTEETDKFSINKLYPQLKETSINTILKDSEGVIWLGTYKKSLIVIGEDQKVGTIRKKIEKHLPKNCSVKILTEDSKHRIWIGTLSDGLFCYSPTGKSFKNYSNTLYSKAIINIIEDEQGRIWFGTIDGLFLYMEQEDQFQLVLQPHMSYSSSTPVPDMIISMCQTTADTFWLGTRQGLIKYSLKDGNFQTFRQSDGLPGENIKGLLYDSAGKHLWISTDKGLSRFDTERGVFTNFGLKDGIIGTEFNDISTLKDSNGVFHFGSVNGIYTFHPEQIKTNPHMPKVVITNYRLYDSEFKSGTAEQTNKYPIPKERIIKIPYKESIFSIDFVALNYTNPDKNQYAYKLEGYDDNWKYIGDQRMATYTNLSPGKYVFKVIASNNDGVWNNEGSHLKIQILPPWWRTYWAYSFYILLVAGVVFISIHIYTVKLQMQNQIKNEQFEREQLKKLDLLKMQFFSNITHEFRTPLTLIISPLETLIAQQKNSREKENYIEVIYNNAKKILELVNRLLDFSKADSGCFEFHPVTTEISSFISNETESFLPLAEEKQIKLNFVEHKKDLVGKTDPNIIAKIMGNLLSNAIKYTPKNGTVTVELNLDSTAEKKQLVISVKDNGKGIPENKQQRIFERFYQLDKDAAHGTGIGLSLVKSLTELHNGTIHVTSKPNHGSTFTVYIPFEEEEKGAQETDAPAIHIKEKSQFNAEYLMLESSHENSLSLLPKILIAEDNTDLRKYLISLLDDKYQILEAENGKVALELARKEIPDVILSDVLMPEINGKEFCREIKQDVLTCHIPFIMITALISESNQIDGFTAGADDYITKPFNPELLKSKISNILRNRQLSWRRYATLSALEPDEVVSKDKDSAFLLSAIGCIKANISNPELKVEDLAKNAGMSRTTFFKKTKGMTNMTPNDFIRTIRLNQAAKLLTETDLNITEITYSTGFTSPKYFRECFKKQFKQTPSEYIKKHKTS